MFKNKSKEASQTTASSPSTSSGATNTITSGTTIEGIINASSDIRIDGQLKGTLHCSGRVIIGPEGVVTGDVDCQNAVVEGSFSGNLKVSEVLNIKESARIDGEIVTGKLQIHPGAIFNGNCSMGGQKLKSLPREDQKAQSV